MWIIFALTASVLWGLTYVFSEQIYKQISVVTSLAISSLAVLVVMLVVAAAGGFLNKDLGTILRSSRLQYLIFAEAAALILAELAIGFSIAGKNATLAGLIEISYPIFIAIFTFLLWKESEISLSVFVGALLIFSGVFVIYYFNK